MLSPRHRVAHPPPRPLVLFDGECRFCRVWADRWRAAFAGRVDVAPFQEAGVRFPEIPPEALGQAMQLVEPDGSVHAGASAVLRARAQGRGRRGLTLWAYRTVPGAAALLEFAYRIVARNRRLFSMLMR